MSKLVRVTNQIDSVRELLVQIRREPYDDEARSVLADWCEEKGFSHAAETLRLDPGDASHELLLVLSGLRSLFGEKRGESLSRGRYSAVLAVPPRYVQPASTETLEMSAQVSMRLRRLVLSDRTSKAVRLADARVGVQSLLLSPDPVMGELFTMFGPETFDSPIFPGQRISLTFENVTEQDLVVSGCLLGVTYDHVPILRMPTATGVPSTSVIAEEGDED